MATILITGGTGMVGSRLQEFLTEKGHEVVVLVRPQSERKESSNPLVSYAEWDVEKGQVDKEAIAKANYIIHLAGANLADKRWTKKRKKEIVESRTKSSALLIKAMSEVPNNVKAVISTSAMGWYGPDTPRSKEKGFKEDAPSYDDFLGETCRQWEASIQPVTGLNKRLAIFRFGIVLSETGGVVDEFKKPLKFGVAAILGNGNQTVSWIHIYDLCRLFLFGIENDQVQGVYNAVSPKPVSSKEFTLNVAKKFRGNTFIPVHVPGFVVKLVKGEMSIEALKSATVNDEKIRKAGFTFLYPSIQVAIESLAIG